MQLNTQKHATCTLGVLMVVIVIAAFVLKLLSPSRQFGQLIGGDQSVHLRRVVIQSNGDFVVISKSSDLRYLEACLRSSSRAGRADTIDGKYVEYVPCTVWFGMASGDYMVDSYFTEGHMCIYTEMRADLIEPGWPNIRVDLVDPVPSSVNQAWDFAIQE